MCMCIFEMIICVTWIDLYVNKFEINVIFLFRHAHYIKSAFFAPLHCTTYASEVGKHLKNIYEES